MRRSLTKYLSSALLLAGTACSQPLAPESLFGTYQLASAVAPVETATHRHELLSAEVEIDGDRLVRTSVASATELATGVVEIVVFSQTMVYRIDGARIVTSMTPCVGICAAVLVHTPDYRVLADGLLEIGGSGATGTFVRVPVSSYEGMAQ